MAAKHPILFLGGVPCSGKTHLCRKLLESVVNLRHEIAGRLIYSALSDTRTDYERPPVQNQAVANSLQDLLVVEFGRVREAHDGPLVLDGHYVVPTEHGPGPVMASVFQQLGVSHLAVCEVEPGLAVTRLRQRRCPEWWDGRLGSIQELALLERHQAAVVGGQLGVVPVIADSTGGVDQLTREVFCTR